jgi:hypothetical protein
VGTQKDKQTGERKNPANHGVREDRQIRFSNDEVRRGLKKSREVVDSKLPRKAAIVYLVPVP